MEFELVSCAWHREKSGRTQKYLDEIRKGPAVRKFVVCVRNEGYEASLERNKIYVVLPGDQAERAGDLRVMDESGEDYLFAADRSLPSKSRKR